MAAVISALLRAKQNQLVEVGNNEESLLETLVTIVPAKDSWVADFPLGMMVLG